MVWFSLAKIAVQAGTHIFKKRQETKDRKEVRTQWKAMVYS